MTVFGKEEEKLPVHSKPGDVQHRDVLPQGKPKGVAEVNGKSFEEAGVKPSDYEEHEYDVQAEFDRAGKVRNRELYGSASSGDVKGEDGEKDGVSVLDKVKAKMNM